MTQHTLFIIPGSVAPAKRYAKLASYIESTSDFKVHVYTLPTTSNGPPNGPAAGLIDDVAFTKAKLQELIHSGEDILLLAHSYGAMVANIVAKDLGKEQRLKHGLRGGITRIIYLCAIIAPTGQSVADVCQHLDLSWLNEPKEVMNLKTMNYHHTDSHDSQENRVDILPIVLKLERRQL